MTTAVIPLCKYRGAVLGKSRLRRVATCAKCETTLHPGLMVWRAIREKIARHVDRSQRFCRSHFEDGQEYES